MSFYGVKKVRRLFDPVLAEIVSTLPKLVRTKPSHQAKIEKSLKKSHNL